MLKKGRKNTTLLTGHQHAQARSQAEPKAVNDLSPLISKEPGGATFVRTWNLGASVHVLTNVATECRLLRLRLTRRARDTVFLLLQATIGCWLLLASTQAADVIVGEGVPPAQQVTLRRIDHSAWDSLLRKYVDEKGLVGYKEWKNSTADLLLLEQYLNHLSHSDGQGTQQEQLAFWINAYNAVTVKGILREYPTSSIRNHTAKLWGYNIWKNLKLNVGNKPISLDEIEHQVLRKMDEPRIHFAIVCASIGCPRLLNEAYTPARLDDQLTANAKSFFADPSKFRFDGAKSTFYASPILDWFGEDFGNTMAVRLQRIATWLPDAAAQRSASSGSGNLAFLEYDWSLNDQK